MTFDVVFQIVMRLFSAVLSLAMIGGAMFFLFWMIWKIIKEMKD